MSRKEPEIKRHKSIDPDNREQQVVKAAYDLAEKQIIEGTASPSVIVHFLRLGTKKEILEREILEKQKVLIEAKTANVTKENENEQLTKAAIEAIKGYRGTE